MTPTILFYNLDNEKGRKIKLICLKLKIRIKKADKNDYFQPIGSLFGLMEPSENVSFSENTFSDEMLVMKDFSNQLLDRFLLEFKKNHIERVDLKAILTPDNISWNSIKLHEELVKEHESMK
ncbi:MAG: DUF3783 domain-containing protein [Lachnospiraceae bacterium]|uniref:DUF3783 domain-containing protein n=1 Tax=Roseburia hominis TaxID=301301 RepID=UPI001F42B284|nr:DUF3783 domain-containing protein [Roseburia hominis]MCI5712075.1 DUF3783 domain-containing protein [Lachnospiraceae bacterium]MDD6168920.1 DUF3783 domain-containing protein [Lachnospiraceae bacterium]MDY4839213.1 DUF3783 domain-containing protein [Lachnospiraceae bacterium]